MRKKDKLDQYGVGKFIKYFADELKAKRQPGIWVRMDYGPVEFVGYMKNMNIPGAMPYPGISASASEDFASIADKIPGTFMYLSAGFLDDRGGAPAHNPKVMFNEDVCPIGASSYAHCATEWLKNNK